MVKHVRIKENFIDHNSTTTSPMNEFDISHQDLEFLMQTHNHDSIKELNDAYGGLYGLEKKLQTNFITGLTGDRLDLIRRRKIFGENELPKKLPKSFFRLMFEASRDTTLIILMICAIISFGLAIYQTDRNSFEYQLPKHRK